MRIRRMEPQHTMVVRVRSAPEALGEAFRDNLHRVFSYVREAGGEVTGHVFGRYMAMEDGEFDVEMGVPVRAPLPPSGDIHASGLPGGEAAVVEHRGPYHELGRAHDELLAWKRANGRSGGPQWESYVDDPSGLPPARVLTEVFAPLDGRA